MKALSELLNDEASYKMLDENLQQSLTLMKAAATDRGAARQSESPCGAGGATLIQCWSAASSGELRKPNFATYSFGNNLQA